MAAVANFFGISGDQSYATFLSSGYVGPGVLGHLLASASMPTPADVIARLQVLLIEKRALEPSLMAFADADIAIRAVAQFPVAAHQTGQAELPHPAFRLASSQGTRWRHSARATKTKHA